MSSAETTHPIEWRGDGAGGALGYFNGKLVGMVDYWPECDHWSATVCAPGEAEEFLWRDSSDAARSFVEKSVKEAGHGE